MLPAWPLRHLKEFYRVHAGEQSRARTVAGSTTEVAERFQKFAPRLERTSHAHERVAESR